VPTTTRGPLLALFPGSASKTLIRSASLRSAVIAENPVAEAGQAAVDQPGGFQADLRGQQQGLRPSSRQAAAAGETPRFFARTSDTPEQQFRHRLAEERIGRGLALGQVQLAGAPGP